MTGDKSNRPLHINIAFGQSHRFKTFFTTSLCVRFQFVQIWLCKFLFAQQYCKVLFICFCLCCSAKFVCSFHYVYATIAKKTKYFAENACVRGSEAYSTGWFSLVCLFTCICRLFFLFWTFCTVITTLLVRINHIIF